jgi:hypothetical protein
MGLGVKFAVKVMGLATKVMGLSHRKGLFGAGCAPKIPVFATIMMEPAITLMGFVAD